MQSPPTAQLERYAELLIKIGVNLQPGQGLRLGAELAHAPFVRILVAVAYQTGARYVHVDWLDTPSMRARLLFSNAEFLEWLPTYEVTRHQQMVDEGWARLVLVGPEFPDLLNDIEPARMRRFTQARAQQLKFYSQAQMANRLQWTIAAIPTPAWARQIFPDLAQEEAMASLWRVILQTLRIDQPDPIAAWRTHERNLQQVTRFMAERQIRALHFLDSTPGPDGLPATDLRVGLTDFPVWLGASSATPAGVQFLPNMPTEEVFTTPHNERTTGWVRTSKPAFPFERRVNNAYFRFVQGEVVEFYAETGQEVLEEFFTIRGAKRLGEISLVDVRSPINQSGLIFYETLFDENAVCHLAFGEAYPGGVEHGATRSAEELSALGVNAADTHVDFMIGAATMDVIGHTADGSSIVVMHNGQLVDEVLA